MTLRKALEEGKVFLREKQVPDADLDAWYLLEYVTGMDRAAFLLHGKDEAEEETLQAYRILLQKRGERIPLQYLTERQMFMGLEFKVNSHVLIPRQDTECLVEEVQKHMTDGMRILDLCTGSGCILISLLHENPTLQGVGSDCSKQALLVAKENAKKLGVSADWICSDLFSNLTGTFDCIVSNPPYIETAEISDLMPEVREFEPYDALDGGRDGLDFYRRIIREQESFLVDGGMLFFEIGWNQGKAVAEEMAACGFTDIKILPDLCGKDRIVRGRREKKYV